MGCNVHMIVQVNENNDWRTTHLDAFTGRSYDLFGILAGVRSHNFNTIADPKGIPPNLAIFPVNSYDTDIFIPLNGTEISLAGRDADSDNTKYWLGEHNHSHLTATEVLAYDWDMQVDNGYFYDDDENIQLNTELLRHYVGFDAVLNLLTDLSNKHGKDNVRLVFGFDS